MAYCKRCVCGNIEHYSLSDNCPEKCSRCGRWLYSALEEKYTLTVVSEQPPVKTDQEIIPDASTLSVVKSRSVMYLESPNSHFSFPVSREITVGRNSIGQELLEKHLDISREHFTIAPRCSGVGATITDLSSFGTYLNGHRLPKNVPHFVLPGTTIRLASEVELRLIIKEESENAEMAEMEARS